MEIFFVVSTYAKLRGQVKKSVFLIYHQGHYVSVSHVDSVNPNQKLDLPMAKAIKSVTEVIVIATPACFIVIPNLTESNFATFFLS